MSELSDITENYYDSDDADRFYYHIWGGEDIHIGLYEEGESDIRLASRRTVEAMATKLKHWPGGTRLLDIGAGYGGSGRYLIKEHRFDVTSLNLSKIQNQRNREFNQLQGLCSQHVVVDGNFESLPFGESTFDLVWSQDAVLHSGNRYAVFEEINRVLKPGGEFIFSDPMQRHGASATALDPVLKRIHLASLGSFETYDDYRKKLGWENLSVTDLTPQLVNHYAAVRANLESRRKELSAIVSEAYIDQMIRGLDHWVEAGKARVLAWGIMHYRKP